MNALEVINKKLEEKKSQIVEFVASGKAINFENYAALVGEIRGITHAMNEIEDMGNMLLRQEGNDD
jgi:hypothetical protein